MRTWEQRRDAYFKSFCRRIFRWSPAYKEARARALVGRQYINGKRVEFYDCEWCHTFVERKQSQVDHKERVIPLEGWNGSWDELKRRMSFEDPANLQVLCKPCHQKKCKAEMTEQRATRRKK